MDERVRDEMKWLLPPPPAGPGSAPAPGPGPGPGALEPRSRSALFRVFTMVRPGGPGPRRAAAPAQPREAGAEGRRSRESGAGRG